MSKLLKLATVAFTFAVAASMGTANAMSSTTDQMITSKVNAIKTGLDSMSASTSLSAKVTSVESQVKDFCNQNKGSCLKLKTKLLTALKGVDYSQLKSKLLKDWGVNAKMSWAPMSPETVRNRIHES